MTWQPVVPQGVIQESKVEATHHALYDLASEITFCHFNNILLTTQVNPFTVRDS